MKITASLLSLFAAGIVLTACSHDYATRPQPGTSQDPNVVRNSSSGSITPAAPDDGR
jgi:hypothetical protein